eukprot:TCONS_00020411-protein
MFRYFVYMSVYFSSFDWSIQRHIVVASITTQSTTNTPWNTEGCDVDWYRFKESCYLPYKQEQYHNDASKICQKHSATLATIMDEQENQFIKALANQFLSYGESWLGLVRSERLGTTFTWADGQQVSYERWMFNKPSIGDGDCVQLISSGFWTNINCYNRFSFICKKDKNLPPAEDNLDLILNISIPLSCVFIMFCFVAFLCFKSYKELQEIKQDNLDGKPFELIQAAMILPITKTPDLLTSNGKNLWKSALERLKAEQIKNNPLNEPHTFLARGSLSSIVDAARKNGQIGGNRAANMNTDNSFADIVNSLMSKRRDTTFQGGLMGFPIIENPNVPKIAVDSPEHDKLNKDISQSTNNSRQETDPNFDFSSNASTESLDSNHNPKPRDQSYSSDDNSADENTDTLKNHQSKSYKSNSKRFVEVVVELYDVHEKLKHKTTTSVKRRESHGNGCPNPNHEKRNYRPDNKRNSVNSIQDTKCKRESVNCTPDTKRVSLNSKPNDHRDSVFYRPDIVPNTTKPRPSQNSTSSIGTSDSNSSLSNDGTNSDILSTKQFRDSIRKESEKRKEQYFPNSPEKKLPPVDYNSIPFKSNVADYTTVTLV